MGQAMWRNCFSCSEGMLFPLQLHLEPPFLWQSLRRDDGCSGPPPFLRRKTGCSTYKTVRRAPLSTKSRRHLPDLCMALTRLGISGHLFSTSWFLASQPHTFMCMCVLSLSQSLSHTQTHAQSQTSKIYKELLLNLQGRVYRWIGSQVENKRTA